MCGFCGIIAAAGVPCPADRLVAMQETLGHRGPDGEGHRVDGEVGLAHTRLSIIDVAGGAQPLCNEDGTVWIAFNGEIYNYRILRAELIERGHTFRTASDTEVLVHAYEEWGDHFVARLNGIFAFALHDRGRHRVLLARDHLGIKPLFYEETHQGLFFGSEIKAVLAGSGTTPTIAADALQEYLLFRYVAWDRSFFANVRRLPPGHVAVWEDGRLAVSSYWSPSDVRPGSGLGLADAVDRLDQLLAEAVRSQLMSEVPLGVFCSGGVDSGLVTRLAAGMVTPPLHSFSVGFDDPAWDETLLARNTAARAGAEHHVVVCRPETFAREIPRLLWFNDEPLSHPNAVPLALLSRFARERVTVVLTGEGPDELFGGYPRHRIARLAGQLAAVPPLARALGRAAGLLPDRRLRLLGELIQLPFEDGLVMNSRYVRPDLVAALTRGPLDGALETRRALARRMAVGHDGVSSIGRYELQTYLQCALDRADRMSMACGLEARVPFLDVPLVEWGLSLPPRLKVTGSASKRVLKALAARYLDPVIAQGPKSGFGLPLDRWFRGPELAFLVTLMRDRRHPAAEHFDGALLARVLDEHARGADHGELLWLVANVYQWYDVQVVNGGAIPAAA